MAILARRTGSAPTSVRSALQRLAERGHEVRVPLTTDSTGRPVYAFRGRATRYRLPHLQLPANDGDDASSSVAKQGEHSSSRLSEGRRRPATSEPTTRHHGGDDRSSPNQEESERTLPQPPSSQPPIPSPAGSEVGRHRSWAAAVSAARDSGVDELDVEAVAARAIADPETISAPARLRGAPAYAARLAETVYAERLRIPTDRSPMLTQLDSQECEHGEPGGSTPLLRTGKSRCALCRQA